jgi:hypothetical protein
MVRGSEAAGEHQRVEKEDDQVMVRHRPCCCLGCWLQRGQEMNEYTLPMCSTKALRIIKHRTPIRMEASFSLPPC